MTYSTIFFLGAALLLVYGIYDQRTTKERIETAFIGTSLTLMFYGLVMGFGSLFA